MKVIAKEVPHEFVPVQLNITIHTLEDLQRLQTFMGINQTVGEVACRWAESTKGANCSPEKFQEFVIDFMERCHYQLTNYTNQYNPPGAKK